MRCWLLRESDVRLRLGILRLDLSYAVREIGDVGVAALRTELVQRFLQAQQIVTIQPARPLTATYVLRQRLGVLGPGELVVVGRPDVDQRPDGVGPVGRVERRVVDRVPVDLPYVQVVLDLGHPGRLNPVSRPPHPFGGGVVRVRQAGPERALDQGDDAARGFGCAAVVLTMICKCRLLLASPGKVLAQPPVPRHP